MAENPLWQRYGVTQASAYQRLILGQEQEARILIAETPSDVTGFVWYVEKGVFARSGYIMLIGVDPAQQGKGVGEILMEEAERILFEKSDEVFLLVSDFNQQAQRFYQRRGYTMVGALPGYVLPDVSELIYCKKNPLKKGP
jgi:ribosomal protein S18 acetylase RimI-like enzyme